MQVHSLQSYYRVWSVYILYIQFTILLFMTCKFLASKLIYILTNYTKSYREIKDK